jgi:chromosome segregation ATPase
MTKCRELITGGAVALLMSAPAFSQEAPADAAQPSIKPQAGQQGQSSPRQQIRAIQSKLTQIEQAALEANPELKEKREELKSMVQENMEEEGHTPEEDVARLKEIQKKAQSGDIDKKERKELSQEFQETRQSLAGARPQAMQDEEIQKAQEELNNATLEAMKEEDPQTEELINKMRQLSAQMRQGRGQMRPGGAPQQ